MPPRKKTCPKCGQKLWLREFYRNHRDGSRYPYCKECTRAENRECYRRNRKKPEGVFLHESYGRLMEHRGLATSIYWTGDMLSILRRFYSNTKNEELVGMLGVSRRTLIRKAREMGLAKDKDFMERTWAENRLMASVAVRMFSPESRKTV